MGDKTLTPKQEAFVREYLIDLNATQAATRVGYSPKTAEQQASRLLRNVKIVAAVNKLKSDHLARHNLTIDDISRMLQEDRKFARECGTAAAAVSASMGLAKLYGHLTEKTESVGAVHVTHEIIMRGVNPS